MKQATFEGYNKIEEREPKQRRPEMSGMIGRRENRNVRASRRPVEMLARKLQERGLVFYHDLIQHMKYNYMSKDSTGTILTEK